MTQLAFGYALDTHEVSNLLRQRIAACEEKAHFPDNPENPVVAVAKSMAWLIAAGELRRILREIEERRN